MPITPFYSVRAGAGPFVLTAALLLAACGGATHIESDLGIEDAPDWVNEGTQAVSDKGGRLIQGVGSAPDLGDPSLQRATADNRARAEIARVVSSYIEVALDDYQGSSRLGGVDDEVAADGSVQQQINSVSQVVLNGAKIVGRWKDERTGSIYSFAELDLKRVKDVVKANRAMSEGLKDYLSRQGDAVFDEFAGDR